MALLRDVTWAEVPEAEREVATAHRNARGPVAVVRQGLGASDSSGTRAVQVDRDTEALRGTFRLLVPLLEARGRVEPFRVDLHYQARMWFGGAEATAASLDGDQWRAPGWSVGLPRLLGGILIESDGTRRPARRTTVVANGAEDVDVSYITTDGSDISYRIVLTETSQWPDPTSASAEVRYPDGSLTVMEGVAGGNARGGTSVLHTRLYASAVIDPQGNVTTMEYDRIVSGAAPFLMIRSIVDPLGREVRFHYAGGTMLTAVTGPAPGGGQRVLARLTYRSIQTYWSIHPTDPAQDAMTSGVFAVEGIYHPATATGYSFGDPDSYSRYGMLVKVVEQTGMNHTSSALSDFGTLTPGVTLRSRHYDFPIVAPSTGDRQAFPRYRTLTEGFAGVAAPLVTRYDVVEDPSVTSVTVTLPDASQRITQIDAATGLPQMRRTLDTGGIMAAAEEYTWDTVPGRGPRLTRLTETDRFDMQRRTDYTFTTDGRVRDVTVREWVGALQVANAPMLQRRRYEYVTDPAYAQRGIRGLVSRAEVYGSGALLPEERTDYSYDTTAPQAAAGVQRNIFATTGFRPDLLARLPQNAAALRGQLTRTAAWLAPQIAGNTATIATETSYTTAGSLAEVRVAGAVRTSLTYAAAGGYALPAAVRHGAFVSKGTATSSLARLTWDTATGLLRSMRRPSTGVARFEYDDALRLTRVHNTRELDVRREFASDQRSYTDTTRTVDGAVIATTVTHVDGRGLPTRIVDTPTGAPPVESLFEYDVLGRPTRFERARAAGAAPQWTTFAYDGVGRVERTTRRTGA